MMQRETNISTENQPKGSARNPSDTLDRNAEPQAPAEGGNDTPPPTEGSPKPADFATDKGATEAPPEAGTE